MQTKSSVAAICRSKGGIPKIPVISARITFSGVEGDGHNHAKHNHPDQAISLQDIEILDDLRSIGYPLDCGTIGENLTVRHLHVQKMVPGTVLRFSGGVVLQLTRERKPCYVLDAIDPRLKEEILGRCGYYAKVLREGIVEAGETISADDLNQIPLYSSSHCSV